MFQPGKSGNPGGRPKTKEARDALMFALKNEPDAKPSTKLDAIVRAHIAKAMEGDIPAIKEIYDRVDGKVPQALVGDDEHPGLMDPLTALLREIDGKTKSI